MVRGFCIKSMDNSNQPAEGPNMAIAVLIGVPIETRLPVTTCWSTELLRRAVYGAKVGVGVACGGVSRFRASQPFGPKLRLTMYMSVKVRRIRILALLLAVLFLGAQFHYCVDLSSGPSSSHICPLCSVTGSTVAPSSPSIAITPVTGRLEIVAVLTAASPEVPDAVSPRGPPAV